MALIKETGEIVAGANTYATLAEARAFAALRGVSLSAVDADLEVIAIKAMDYLESFRNEYQGNKLTKEQSLQWPREGAYLDGFEILEDEVPVQLGWAQSQLLMDITSGLDLMPNSDGREILKEKIDVLETTYAQSSSGSAPAPIFTKALAILQPLFGSNSGSLDLDVIRA